MKPLNRFLPVTISTLIFLQASNAASAGSATWTLSPPTGDWNTAANWMPNTVPNGPTDVASFAGSNQTAVSISSDTTVDSIVFSPGASAFTISAISPSDLRVTLTLRGAGIVNNSGVTQNFVSESASIFYFGHIDFTGSASAGTQCVFTADSAFSGGEINFFDQAMAGSSTFNVKGGGGGASGHVNFYGSATAASGTFISKGSSLLGGVGGIITFYESATAGDAVLTQAAGIGQGFGANLAFNDDSSAENATITNYGPAANDQWYATTFFTGTSTGGTAHITNKGSARAYTNGGSLGFDGSSSAGNAVIVNEGGQAVNASGGLTSLYVSTAGSATITTEGGLVTGSFGGLTLFKYQSDAQNATLIANGGPDASSGGQIRFENSSVGGTARVVLSGNGFLDISDHAGRLTIGSAEGEGAILLGSKPLGIGSSNLSTVLGAIVQDGGFGGGTGGSLIKVGTGTLTLTGASTYTGGTNISAGILMVANTEGSGTGAGVVTVTAGTLGGSGTIMGPVTIGTGAFLAPAGGTNIQATLNVESSLTFNAAATYTYTFKAKKKQAKADKVVANGVTINSGASFNLSGQTQGTLTQGLVLTVIRNTAPTPISGTFDNLPDGGIVTVNGNNLQANYEGGDGNDLTLTVVP